MTDYRNLAKSLIRELTGDKNILSIPRKFIDLTGDLNAAALLNQILYWSSRTSDQEGWFYKTYPAWKKEIGLTQYQVKRAIEGDKRTKEDKLTLADLGVQTVRKKHGRGVKLHYRIDMDVFFAQFDAFLNMNNVDNQQCQQSKNMNNVDNPYTETTTETTLTTSASPDGNADGGSKNLPMKLGFEWQDTIKAMMEFPDAPFYQHANEANEYLQTLLESQTITANTEADEVLAIVKRELLAEPDEPKPDGNGGSWEREPIIPNLAPPNLPCTLPRPLEDEPKPKKERKANPWYDAVKEVFDIHGAYNTDMAKMLQGKATKGEYKTHNVEEPLTPELLMRWGRWWKAGNTGLTMLTTLCKIQSSIIGWFEEGCPDVTDQPKTHEQIARERLAQGLPYAY